MNRQPAGSAPHHVVLIADPQRVDPHTYPGRPWPLSALTVRYTDLYMRKSFQQIQATLAPDSVLFLGDLFDGGREWSAGAGSDDERDQQDKRWKKYDTAFWLKEYRRFCKIFFDPWLHGGANGQAGQQKSRKLIAGLPGNHDLGLGNGIRIPVRKRFQAYFGNGNRIDVIGNHTFVSLDTVSLSAKNQINPSTGDEGIVEEQQHRTEIWEPVEQFLHTTKTEKARTIARELRLLHGLPENELLDHDILDLDDPRAHTIPVESDSSTDIPSIVLTHVPLYRDPGTSCGPLRERFPPAKPAADGVMSPDKDDANSIRVQAGIQYQNVLTTAVSREIIDLVGDVSHVFSGDDHDYCDVVHRGYTSKSGGIRETTVKSISWAMGVRKPGILLLSLWNPINQEGISTDPADTTIQTQLCLLPDQLSIFIRYGWLLAATLLVLLFRAVRVVNALGSARQTDGHVSLTNFPNSQSRDLEAVSASTGSRSRANSAAVRSSASRPQSISPSDKYGYGLPLDEVNTRRTEKGVYEPGGGFPGDQGWNYTAPDKNLMRRRRRGLLGIFDEFCSSSIQVAVIVILWYVWLLWNS